MTTSRIQIDEGSTTSLATNTFSEDAVTKHVARSVLNTSAGAEAGTASSPLRVDPTGTTPQPVTGTFYQATQPVSASSLPLPTGASTESTLSSIKTKTDNIPPLGQAVAGSSVPVVLPSTQITTLTPQTDALTDAQLRATPVAVSGTFYQATQPVSGNIGADLRVGGASVTTSNPVPIAPPASGSLVVSGTVTANATLSAETTKVIGTVNISSGQSIESLLQAGTNLVGKVSSGHDTSTVYNGTTALTPKFAKIDISASADIVALVSSKKIRVISMFLIGSADCTIKFQSGGSTDLQGAMTIKAGAGFVLGQNLTGWFETASGEKLNAVVSGTTQISGSLTYIEV